MAGTSRRAFLVMAAATVGLSACGRVRDSRLNPFNWFGRDREDTVEVDEGAFQQDRRRFAEQIVSLNVDPTPEGAIIRAVGLPPTQGYWAAELVEIERDDPTQLVYEFRVARPLEPRRQSTQRSREIIAGEDVSTFKLSSVRSITVIGRANRRTVRR